MTQNRKTQIATQKLQHRDIIAIEKKDESKGTLRYSQIIRNTENNNEMFQLQPIITRDITIKSNTPYFAQIKKNDYGKNKRKFQKTHIRIHTNHTYLDNQKMNEYR